MKPHALRKTLWFANIALTVAVVAVGAWFVTKIRPATAAVINRPSAYRPPELEKIQKNYESERQTGLKWEPDVPVTDEEIHKYILRKDYEQKSPKHWIFNGPLPPTTTKGPDVPAEVEDKPKHLETLGKVVQVIYQPPDKTVVLFAFAGGTRSRAFGIGDWVVENSEFSATPSPQLYKLTGVESVGGRAYKIHYAVYGKDKETPRLEGAMPYGTEGLPPWPAYLHPVEPKVVKPAAVATGPAAVAEGGEGLASPGTVAEGTAAGGTAAEGTASDGAAAAEEGAEAGVVAGEATVAEVEAEVVRVPIETMTVEDMRPEVIYNEKNRDERVVAVDDNTYRFLKSKRAKDIAAGVKTEVAVDRKTGRTIGMRITGLQEGSAAGAFQVKKGDILVSINGRAVESRSAAISIVEGLSPTAIATVVIDRHGKLLTYKVDPTDPKNRRQVRYFDDFK